MLRDLVFFEVRDDPDVVERGERHQRAFRATDLADLDGAARDDARDLRA